MQTLYSIQYLRALAALSVVLFHAGERGDMHFTIGAAGVDVFFVVSGFIMMAISDSRPTRPVAFLRNRFLRIAPSYWAATVAMLLGGLLGLFPNLQITLAHTLGSFLFVPIPSPSNGQLWPLLVQGWTLNYEIFFYVVFALTLFAPSKLRLALLAGTFGLFSVAGMLIAPTSPLIAFYTAPVILEFVAGAAIAKLWRHGQLPPAWVGVILVTLAIAGFATIEIRHMPFGAWSCGPLAVLLVTGALSIEIGGWLPKLRPLAYLGDSSYSIYLWHTFAISVLLKAATIITIPPVLLVVASVAVGTLAGIIAYEGLERPLQFLLRGKRSSLWRFPRSKTAP